MDNNIEYQYLVTELNANEKIKRVLVYEISQMSNMLREKRRFLDEIENHTKQIQERINQLEDKNISLILYDSNETTDKQ